MLCDKTIWLDCDCLLTYTMYMFMTIDREVYMFIHCGTWYIKEYTNIKNKNAFFLVISAEYEGTGIAEKMHICIDVH